VVVPDALSQLGTLDPVTADTMTPYAGGVTTQTNEIIAFNLAPQSQNLSGATFDMVARAISGNYTQASLQSLISNELIPGTGLKPAINGTFAATLLNDAAQTLGGKTSLPVALPIGPNFTLQSALAPLLDAQGAAIGVNAILTVWPRAI